MIKKLNKHLRPDNNTFEELQSLTKIPQKESKSDMPTFQNFVPNFCHQADVLIMPTAKFGYKKIIVVVDTSSKKFDAEPLKSETSDSLVSAFKRIYERNILEKPKMMEFDNGAAFHGAVIYYCKENNIKYRYALTNRHRQQGIVESKNKVLATALLSFVNEKELNNLRKEQAKASNANKKVKVKLVTDWYISKEHFRSVIDYINEHTKARVLKEETTLTPMMKKGDILLDVGTKVRVLLDQPEEIATGKKLFGKFRGSDIRWSHKISEIEWVSLYPGQPVMYRVEGEKILRTREQLQVIEKADPSLHHGFV